MKEYFGFLIIMDFLLLILKSFFKYYILFLSVYTESPKITVKVN